MNDTLTGSIRAHIGLTRLIAVISLLSIFQSLSRADEVLLDYYSNPGISNKRSINEYQGNEFIDPFGGSLHLENVDLHIPGNGGFDLKVIRSYNSSLVDNLNPANNITMMGVGWDMHFGRVLTTVKPSNICQDSNPANVSNNPVLELQDGSRQVFYFGSQLITDQRWKMQCISGGVIVMSPDGTSYEMKQNVSFGSSSLYHGWMTTKITDKNGNYATISYLDPSSRQITNISTNDGRSVNFNYSNSGTFYARLDSISNGSRTITYNYQIVPSFSSTYYLTSSRRPDGTYWEYSYNGAVSGYPAAGGYLVNRVRYPSGGYTSYQYTGIDFYLRSIVGSKPSSVIKGKTNSDGGTWAYSYTPSSQLGILDQTIENGPSGSIIYNHYGYGTVASGEVWKIGVLASKKTGSVQSENYTWDKQKLSSETLTRPGSSWAKYDKYESNTPILSKKSITRNGATYSVTYGLFDSYGNPGVVTASGPNGGNRIITQSYYTNPSKWIVKQIKDESFSGGSINRSFDSNGNLTSETADGITTSYSYDTQGNVSSITRPRTLVTYYSNYKRGIPQYESQPEGVAITRMVSNDGNITSETNGDGKTTMFSYDGLNRVTYKGYPTGYAAMVSYGSSSKTVTRGTLSESVTYDGFMRPKNITLGGITRTYSYDVMGRRIFESNPGSTTGTSYQYDILDRVTRITNQDNTSRSISYGASTKSVTDERGKVTTYTYRSYSDPDQQYLMSVSSPEPTTNVSIVRNSKDLVISATQAGITRSYGYNSNYYLTSETNPETGTTSYGRDSAGNMISRRVGSSGISTFTYDNQNRLKTATYPNGAPAVSNTYNRTHKLLTANSSTGNRSFSYDANGNLTSESLTVDGYVLAANYTYTGNDQLSSITYPRSSTLVNYAPDVLGRPTQVSGYVSSISYWPSGQLKQINYGNGTVTNYNQNSRLWPSSFSTQKSGGTTYLNINYTYDGTGNLTQISNAVDTSFNRTLGYDNVNRLTTVTGPWGAGTFTYDGAGNISRQALGSLNLNYQYSSNLLNSLSGSSVTQFGYDTYGNVVAGYGNTYTYDGVPNLRCANCGNTSYKTEYTYDGTNKRSSVTKSGVKTYEMYGSDGNLLVEFTPSQSNKLVEYIYLAGKRVAQRATP